MIVNTKTGIMISGTIARSPELRRVGQNDRPVLKFSMRYSSERDEFGKPQGKFIDVDIWTKAEELDGMFAEGDSVIVVACEIKTREYNGKVYHSVSADGVWPGADVVFRWMQQVVDMFSQKTVSSSAHQSTAPDISGCEIYTGEQLNHYSPKGRIAAKVAGSEPPIDDAEDLPL